MKRDDMLAREDEDAPRGGNVLVLAVLILGVVGLITALIIY